MYQKSAAVFPFFVNFNDTSKICDRDDTNCQGKIFQTQTGKKMFQGAHNYIFNRFDKLKYLLSIN